MSKRAKRLADEVRETPSERKAHLHAILEKMSNVMFCTFQSEGGAPAVSARPMHVTRLDDDDTMWFMMGLDSKTVAEVQSHEGVFITGQDDARWVHVTGRGTVVTDRPKIREVWTKAHEVWFPDGPEDPNACLVRLVPEAAEYWDTSGMRGAKYLFHVAKALMTGTEPGNIKGLHGDVD